MALRVPHPNSLRAGEVYGAIWTNDYVIGTVELFPIVVVGQNSVVAVRRDRNDRPQHAGAIKQAMLTVICVPVRVTQCNDFFFAPVEIKAINLVLHFIANVEKTGWVPHWAFGKAESPANSRELGIMIYELPKFWRFGLQFEAP